MVTMLRTVCIISQVFVIPVCLEVSNSSLGVSVEE